MKIHGKKTLAAGALSLAVIFGSVGCATTNSESPPTSNNNSSESPAADPNLTQAQAAIDYQEFLDGIYGMDSEAVMMTLTDLMNKYNNETSEPTDEQKQEVIDAMLEEVPELAFIDVEGLSIDETGETYADVISWGAEGDKANVTATVPESAVMFDEDAKEATIDSEMIEYTIDNEKVERGAWASDDNVKLVFKDGGWLMTTDSADDIEAENDTPDVDDGMDDGMDDGTTPDDRTDDVKP